MQYKRPERFTATHRIKKIWPNQEFLRFSVRSRYQQGGKLTIDHRQLEALAQLSARVGDSGRVRYMCPNVWTAPDLYGQFAVDKLVDSCAVVEPEALAYPPGHSRRWHNYWTFPPTNVRIGQPNPAGPILPTQSGLDFWDEIPSLRQETNLADDLANLQRATTDIIREGLIPNFGLDDLGRFVAEALTERLAVEPRSTGPGDPTTNFTVGGALGAAERERRYQEALGQVHDAVLVAAAAERLGLVWLKVTT